MSLLQPVRGSIPVDPGSPAQVAAATRRLCTDLLAHNRLRPGDVVAARFVGGAMPEFRVFEGGSEIGQSLPEQITLMMGEAEHTTAARGDDVGSRLTLFDFPAWKTRLVAGIGHSAGRLLRWRNRAVGG